MVKGISRRVILVKSPDPRLFEEAIFIVREDALNRGVDADQVLREAQKAARGYGRRTAPVGRALLRWTGLLYALAGAAAATAAWAAWLWL